MSRQGKLIAQCLAALALIGSAPGISKADIVINFDDVTAPALFTEVVLGGALGPIYSRDGVTFDGGVVLNDSAYGNESTTFPNLYATTDLSIALAGKITATFSGFTATSITLDVANGNDAANFTLNALNGSNQSVDSDTVALGGFSTAGAVQTVSVSGAGISSFAVTTDQSLGSIDFAIDHVRIAGITATPVVPEPSTLTLCGAAALVQLGCLLRRRKRATA